MTKGRTYCGCFTPNYSFGAPLKNDNGKVQKAQFFRLFEAMDGKILTYKEMKKYISTAMNLQTIHYSHAAVKVGRGRYTLSIASHKYVKEVNKLIK